MKDHRMSKGETEYYTSFDKLRKGWGLKPVNKKTKDKLKLEKQKEDFCKRHICKCCGSPMQLINGTSVMACTNEKCSGEKHEFENNDGEKKIWYTPSFDLLDAKGFEISQNLFA